MIFTQKDIEQIKELGIQPEDAALQLERFSTGFPDISLIRPVEEGDGLLRLNQKAIDTYIEKFNTKGRDKTILKFVPASGAASRMFKLLYNYLEGNIDGEDSGIIEFYRHIEKFAFYDQLADTLSNKESIKELALAKDKRLIEALLTSKGLNYGNLPKALLTFHKYKDGTIRKAIDEHLYEGALYSTDNQNITRLHFTVSSEHMEWMKAHLKVSIPFFESIFKNHFEISFSIQDKATDTIAVNPDNSPFRTAEGRLLFRPGGHGALLSNLDKLDADIIFIKNIDNVAASWLIDETVTYKKTLAGILLEVQNQVFEYCRQLKNKQSISESLEKEIVHFLKFNLGFTIQNNFTSLSSVKKLQVLFSKLHRPIRVCGVVESSNTGGGPFWVRHSDGSESLQLVETAQVNLEFEDQKKVLDRSRFANITDLVCGTKDFEGKNFNLMEFRDDLAGFIAEKSQGGQTLKAMELPGLWNGAMSDWNTIFVKVPMTTFNPVKTVLDLLNKEHQGEEYA